MSNILILLLFHLLDTLRLLSNPMSLTVSAQDASAAPYDAQLYVAIDCEFVGVGPEGAHDQLARVSLVDYFGSVLLDVFVQGPRPVVDYRTEVSGITPELVQEGVEFNAARLAVVKLIDGKVLVGHSIKHDLLVLQINWKKYSLRDSQDHRPFLRRDRPQKLKYLARGIGLSIQSGEHSSVEDAQAVMAVYRAHKDEMDRCCDHYNT